MNFYDNIQAYLNNTLSAEDRISFEEEMARDNDLRMTVEEFPVILEAIEASAQDEARTMVQRTRVSFSGQERHPAQRRVLPLRRLSIAATFLVLILAGALIYANLKYSTPALIQSAYTAPSDLGTFQSDNVTNAQWADVMLTWENGKTEEALNLANDFLADHPGDADAIRRVAHLQFQAGNFEEALMLYGSIRQNRQFGNYADFHFALTLIKLDRLAEARDLLSSLAANEEHRFAEEAVGLLERLNSPWRRLAFN